MASDVRSCFRSVVKEIGPRGVRERTWRLRGNLSGSSSEVVSFKGEQLGSNDPDISVSRRRERGACAPVFRANFLAENFILRSIEIVSNCVKSRKNCGEIHRLLQAHNFGIHTVELSISRHRNQQSTIQENYDTNCLSNVKQICCFSPEFSLS